MRLEPPIPYADRLRARALNVLARIDLPVFHNHDEADAHLYYVNPNVATMHQIAAALYYLLPEVRAARVAHVKEERRRAGSIARHEGPFEL